MPVGQNFTAQSIKSSKSSWLGYIEHCIYCPLLKGNVFDKSTKYISKMSVYAYRRY